MSTPLTDSINALTAYANEVTGGSDTNLSDAVHTLASGYGGGILGDLLEVKHVVHVSANTKELLIPFFGFGMYYVVSHPLVTAQDAVEANLNDVLSSCAFLIYGHDNTKSMNTGPTFLYDKNGRNDYWSTTPLTFIDDEKTTISMKVGNGAGNILGNHDYYVIRPKDS